MITAGSTMAPPHYRNACHFHGGIDQLDIAQSLDPTEEISGQGFDDVQTAYDDFDHDVDGVELADSDLGTSEDFDGDMDLDVDSDVGGFFDIFG